jgi:hypothetical protein
MINNQLKNIKRERFMARRKNTFEEKMDLNRVLPSRPGHGSTGFCWVFAHPGLLFYPDRFSHRVDRVPDQPVGSVQV